ncbi:hypothetical protein SAMN04488516_104104 [Desulfonauticus submarinus]|uniref:Uncharacterized protein n=1 Tax=Desulfonauticus submarinus TaxID=206665 RepID=A0A1H0DB82_9BACT|nr:hypothetical protein [Desulfonauticus submarinus]SDN67375.1 hypothetical protein SAMN04488516_104104 [Desulfonauticus submarinus]
MHFSFFFSGHPIKPFGILGLVLWLILIPLGCFSLSCIIEIFYLIYKKSVLDKLSNQLARLGFIFLSAITLSIAIICLVPGFQDTAFKSFFIFKQTFLICIATAFLLSVAYIFSWKALKNLKILHILLGFSSLASYKIFLSGIFLILFNLALPQPKLLPPLHSLFYPILGQLFILSFVFAISVAWPYLILRRNKDDFGRDYYRFAIKHLSKWNLIMLGASFIPCTIIFLMLKEKFLFSPLLGPASMIILGMGLLAILSVILLKQNQPLRYKAWFFLAPLPALVILIFRLISYVELIKMWRL